MILYLTFNDYPSGIYSSQVIDVIKYTRQHIRKDIGLLAFVSLRNYFSVKAEIKAELSDAMVLPMFPGVGNWRRNYFLLRLYCRKLGVKQIIGRSVLATQLALKLKNNNLIERVVYDGRGAIAAEWKEYKVIEDKRMLEEIEDLEREVVLKSDFRIAVSNALIEYWETHIGYAGGKHVVIPSTLNSVFQKIELNEQAIESKRKELGFSPSDIVLIYSGSVSGWQSFELYDEFLKTTFKLNPQAKMLFLSDQHPTLQHLISNYPNRVLCKKVAIKQVPEYLAIGDYGILIREQSMTNQVASPVKFAEYLSCGLKVIISEGIGDYTHFVRDNKCGFVYSQSQRLEKINLEEKMKVMEMARKNFVKEKYLPQYKEAIGSSPT